MQIVGISGITLPKELVEWMAEYSQTRITITRYEEFEGLRRLKIKQDEKNCYVDASDVAKLKASIYKRLSWFARHTDILIVTLCPPNLGWMKDVRFGAIFKTDRGEITKVILDKLGVTKRSERKCKTDIY